MTHIVGVLFVTHLLVSGAFKSITSSSDLQDFYFTFVDPGSNLLIQTVSAVQYGSGEPVEVRFRFTTHVDNQPLVKISFGSELSTYFYIEHGLLYCDLAIRGRQTIYFDWVLDVSNGDWHWLSVKIDIRAQALIAQLDDVEYEQVLKSLASDSIILHFELTEPNNQKDVGSFVGCVSSVIIRSGNTIFSTTLRISGVSRDKTGCSTNCTGTTCPENSKCINLFKNHACECSNRSSACHESDMVANFDGRSTLSYRIGYFGSQKLPVVRKLSLKFKIHDTTRLPQFLFEGLLPGLGLKSVPLALILNAEFYVVLRVFETEFTYPNFAITKNQLWHDLQCTLNYTRQKIEVVLDDRQPVEISFRPAKTKLLDVSKSQPRYFVFGSNFVGCMKQIRINYESIFNYKAKLIDKDFVLQNTCSKHKKRNLPDFSHGPSIDPCVSLMCLNGGTCTVSVANLPFCTCRKGYVGKRCQFSNLPQSCHDFRGKSDETGVLLIDPTVGLANSSEPIFVHCVYFSDDNVYVTSVGHNLPSKSLVRSKDIEDSTITLTYKYVTEASLAHLIDYSAFCSQTVTYSCSDAPLFLFNKSTVFQSVTTDDSFYTLGDNSTCQTSWSRDLGPGHVTKRQNCLCDAIDRLNNQPLQDKGIFYGPRAGVNKMSFLQYPGSGQATLSLGNVTCKGHKFFGDKIQFTSDSLPLQLPFSWKGQRLGLAFKINLSNASLLWQQDANRVIHLAVESGAYLRLKMSLDDYKFDMQILAHSPINDDQWHDVTFEYSHHEIRLSLDQANQLIKTVPAELIDNFLNTNQNTFLELGANFGDARFVGCISRLQETNRFINLTDLVSKSNRRIQVGCQSLCDQQKLVCGPEGQCIENYDDATNTCKCPNDQSMLTNCSRYGNAFSVTLLNKTASFLKITDATLTADIEFQFRTNQPGAVLLYIHDEFYNFIEIVLWSAYKITLTTNDNRLLRQCTVTSLHKDLSSMEWVRVSLKRIHNGRSLMLKVNDLSCIIANQSYSLSYVDLWDNVPAEFPNLIQPPKSPFPPTHHTSERTLLFLGGVQRANFIYISKYPNLIGSLRNIKMSGRLVDPRAYANTLNGVIIGLKPDCESLKCENGAVCNVDWNQPELTPFCDCRNTPFFGEYCSEQEPAYKFSNGAYLTYNPSGWLPISDWAFQFFYFDFRTIQSPLTVYGLRQRVVLAVVQLPDDYCNMTVSLNPPYGHMFVEFKRVSDSFAYALYEKTFEFRDNFADGKRHTFYVRFIREANAALFRIDQHNVEVDGLRELFGQQHALMAKVYLGGDPRGPNKFEGCISAKATLGGHTTQEGNMAVNFLQMYRNGLLSDSVFLQNNNLNLSQPAIEQCSDYFDANSHFFTSFYTDPLPDWDPPLYIEPYTRPEIQPDGDDSNILQRNKTGYATIIVIVVSVIFLLLLATLWYMCKIRSRSSHPADKNLPTAAAQVTYTKNCCEKLNDEDEKEKLMKVEDYAEKMRKDSSETDVAQCHVQRNEIVIPMKSAQNPKPTDEVQFRSPPIVSNV